MSQDHGPIEPRNILKMNALAEGIDKILNGDAAGPGSGIERQWGFAFLVFPFGEKPDGRMNYISNGNREDMLVAMKEFIAKSEGMNMPQSKTKN